MRLSRRDALGLGAALLLGWAAGRVLLRTAPVGRDVGGNPAVGALLRDRASPAREVRSPTLTVVVFGDYQCPACKLAEPELAAALARDGHVRAVYREWPIFGARSERAARVALAAARQGRYLAVHDRLMAERRPLDEAVLRAAVEAAGGDWARIGRDLAAAGPIDARLAADRRAAAALGLKGTPAFLVGPILVLGAVDEAAFVRAFADGREAGLVPGRG